jgi:hypothetical protein
MGGHKGSVAALTGALAVAACAGGADRYPSLALRDFEKRTSAVAAPISPPAAPAAPSLPAAERARIAALVTRAEQSAAAFAKQQPESIALVRRARGQGGDSAARAAALVALADLTALRSATFVPLGELDLLAAEASANYGDTAPIAAAQTAVLAQIARQDAALSALWQELGQ